jgi:DNA primase
MLSSSQKEYLELATERYSQALSSNETAINYLGSRGINAVVAHGSRLGVVDDPMSGHEQYQGMISIPFCTPSGVVQIKFRQLGDAQPKYLGDGESRLYNVGALHKSTDVIAICEGELDTIILDGVVGVPAVGVPGVSHWKKHYPRCLEGFERVLVFADNDSHKGDGSNPGFELAKRIMRDLPQARLVALPKGQDVTDAYLASGKELLLELAGR